MPIQYNDPAGGSPSSIGSQIRTDMYERKALQEAQKEMYFSQLGSTKNIPRNRGKAIKKYHYLPMLDDANVNSQGIDVDGLSTTVEVTITILKPEIYDTGNGHVALYAVGEGANAGAALTAARADAVNIFKNEEVFNTDYATTKTAIEAAGWTVTEGSDVPATGNLYGSSKDIGKITDKLPLIGETGGKVNRVGFTRIEVEGSIENYGFYTDYTEDSMNFDSDSELMMHLNREMMHGAIEMHEDVVQKDILSSAGIVRFTGDAISTDTLTGESGGTISVPTYNDFVRLAIDLSNNRCPKQTTIIRGVRLDDTITLDATYVMYIGSELLPVLKQMQDFFGEPAFIPVQKYAAGTTVLSGEVGAIDQFRIIVVPEMQHWAGAGETVTTNGGYRETDGAYDVFPLLVVGNESFSTLGFQSSGEKKYKVIHRPPGTPDSNDPYEKTGRMSIQWWYGMLIERPERIAVMKCVAPW